MATEQVVEQVTENVAEHIEEVADVARTVEPIFVKGLVIGAGIGLAVGFFWGYRWNKEKIRAEAFAQSEEEVRKIREAFQASRKPPLEEVIEEKGYSPEVEEVEERPTRPSVPVSEPTASRKKVQAPQRNQDKGWSYEEELPNRNRNHPYVIHQDEFRENPNDHTQLTWTYYAADNILLDERDEVVVRPELTVGEMNLKRFGHGSDDDNVVFVRNDRIEIDWEICRTLKSYEVEVLGLDGDESGSEDDSD